MKLQTIFRRRTLDPLWEYATTGAIWRVLPSGNAHIAGEERDRNAKRTSFFVIDSVTGRELWHRDDFGEEWWIGIEVIAGETMYLHKYAKPDMPEHRGIIAVDMKSGRTLWSDEDRSLLHASSASVFVGNNTPGGREVFELEGKTGRELRAWGADLSGVRAAVAASEPVASTMPQLPEIRTGAGRSDDDPALLPHLPPNTVPASVEFLRTDRFLLVSYHEVTGGDPDHPLYRNCLTMVDSHSGTALWRETLNDNVSAIAPISFFVVDGILFFIREYRTLVAVRIDDRQEIA